MSGVTLVKAVKNYGDLQAIHEVAFEIGEGEFCVFFASFRCSTVDFSCYGITASFKETHAKSVNHVSEHL